MSGKLNSWIRSFFTLSKSEQRGIIILIVIIIIITVSNLFLPYFIDDDTDNLKEKYKQEITAFLENQETIGDSIKKVTLSRSVGDSITLRNKFSLVKFNPNNLSVEEWKNMGFTDSQITNIKNYQKAGGKFYKKSDLKKIYAISDEEFDIIEPYIIIPKKQKEKINKKKRVNSTLHKPVELNSADSAELVSSLSFPPWLAKRTIKYRDLLGGFYSIDQLSEIYGIPDEMINKSINYMIIDTSDIIKIDINKVEFKELIKHPYFNFELTQSIFNIRSKTGSFDKIDQLKLIDGLTDSTYNKVSKYLYIRPQ